MHMHMHTADSAHFSLTHSSMGWAGSSGAGFGLVGSRGSSTVVTPGTFIPGFLFTISISCLACSRNSAWSFSER